MSSTTFVCPGQRRNFWFLRRLSMGFLVPSWVPRHPVLELGNKSGGGRSAGTRSDPVTTAPDVQPGEGPVRAAMSEVLLNLGTGTATGLVVHGDEVEGANGAAPAAFPSRR